jgi:hypothetical protein
MVEVIEQLGSETLSYVRIENGETLVSKHATADSPKLNQEVGLALDKQQIYLFDSQEQALNNTQTTSRCRIQSFIFCPISSSKNLERTGHSAAFFP